MFRQRSRWTKGHFQVGGEKHRVHSLCTSGQAQTPGPQAQRVKESARLPLPPGSAQIAPHFHHAACPTLPHVSIGLISMAGLGTVVHGLGTLRTCCSKPPAPPPPTCLQVFFSSRCPLLNWDLPLFQRLWYSYAAWAPITTILTVPGKGMRSSEQREGS